MNSLTRRLSCRAGWHICHYAVVNSLLPPFSTDENPNWDAKNGRIVLQIHSFAGLADFSVKAINTELTATMTTSTLDLLPGTEVHARGLRWEVVSSQGLGPQTLFWLRGLENPVLGHELDVLHPFEAIEPTRHELRPERAAPLVN